MKSIVLLLLICAPILGCQTVTSKNVCAGFEKLTPRVSTSVYIIQNDRTFANQVAGHNKSGTVQGCWK